MLANTHLVLYMSKNISLGIWQETGLLSREMALYQALQPSLARITIISYGSGVTEQKIAESYPNIHFIYNTRRWPRWLYKLYITCIAPWRWRNQPTIVKSEQTNGALVAWIASLLARARFIARSGYMLSDFSAEQRGDRALRSRLIRFAETWLNKLSDAVIVTTEPMKAAFIQRGVAQKHITLIPNYVDTTQFRPAVVSKDIDIVAIGRLEKQKNFALLLEAVEGAGVKILLIGAGSLAGDLRAQADAGNLNIQFMPTVPNADLPHYLQRARIYVMPSLYEGMPKTLIEAMACGCAVIGTDVPGIREIIQPEKTGLLSGLEPEALRHTIKRLLADNDLQAKLGANARAYAQQHFSLTEIVKQELSVYEKIL